jgi:hypothetical protein
MMDGGMGSMMGGMMALGWLGVAIVVLLLIGAIVALVRLLSPNVSVGEGSGLNILLIVFAVIGVLGALALLGGFFMHWGMLGMMG